MKNNNSSEKVIARILTLSVGIIGISLMLYNLGVLETLSDSIENTINEMNFAHTRIVNRLDSKESWTCVKEDVWAWGKWNASSGCLSCVIPGTLIEIEKICLIEYNNVTETYRLADTKKRCEVENVYLKDKEDIERICLNGDKNSGVYTENGINTIEECIKFCTSKLTNCWINQKLVCGDQTFDLEEI